VIYRPDPTNIKSLKLFFEENRNLKTSELAQLAGRSMRTIQKWRAKIGKPGKQMHPDKRPKKEKKEYPIITDRSVWDNEKWFRHMYEELGYGSDIIGRMIQRDSARVLQKLRRYGIRIRSFAEAMASKNPHCNKDWIVEHYEVQNCTLIECAKMAGVNPYTFYEWLIRFQIHIRDAPEALFGERNHYYGRYPRIPIQEHDLGQNNKKEKPSEVIRRVRNRKRSRECPHRHPYAEGEVQDGDN
jgi:transposase